MGELHVCAITNLPINKQLRTIVDQGVRLVSERGVHFLYGNHSGLIGPKTVTKA